MDVDGATVEIIRKLSGQHLHVSGEHHQVDLSRRDQSPEGRLCLWLGGRRDREVHELHAVTRRRGLVIGVVRDDRRNVGREFVGCPALEKIHETVLLSRHHDQNARPIVFASNGEDRAELMGAAPKSVHDFGGILDRGLESGTHAEHGARAVAELGIVQDVRPALEKAFCDRGDDSRAVRALHGEDVGGHATPFGVQAYGRRGPRPGSESRPSTWTCIEMERCPFTYTNAALGCRRDQLRCRQVKEFDHRVDIHNAATGRWTCDMSRPSDSTPTPGRPARSTRSARSLTGRRSVAKRGAIRCLVAGTAVLVVGAGCSSDVANGERPGVPRTVSSLPTSSTPAHDHGAAPVGNLERFRNTNSLYTRFAAIPADSLNARALLVDGHPDAQWFKSNALNPPTGVNGQFRTRCEFSHLSNDDPIVKPGQPGAAHLHMYYGNTAADTFSTPWSIANSGGSTCDGFELNRTAYWFPTLMDVKGDVRIPNNMMLYYKGENGAPPPGGFSEMPAGLKMIAGNPAATSPQPAADNFGWACGDMFANPKVTLIPSNCTSRLMLKVAFPRCWNGRTDFDAADALSFVVYASAGPAGGTCPKSHPKVFPVVSALFDWEVNGSTAGWHLSSDVKGTTTLPGGTTMHGDWFGGWQPAVMTKWTTGCINAEWNCQTSFLGTSNLVSGPAGTVNQLAPTPLVYADKGPVVLDL